MQLRLQTAVRKRQIRNKGFTLIELIIVISITASVFLVSINMLDSYRRIKNNIECKACSNSILNFIQSAKQYCRKNETAGKISVFEDNTFCFKANNTIIKKLKMPDKFKNLSINVNTEGGRISINEEGLTGSAGSIKYEDRKGTEHVITICVGTSYADIKN